MSKGTGRFLGRGSFTIHTGGSGLVKYYLKPGDLIRSNSLPDRGAYEVESSSEPCCYDRCGFQGSTVRRVDMRHLTKEQRGRVMDVSTKLEGMVV